MKEKIIFSMISFGGVQLNKNEVKTYNCFQDEQGIKNKKYIWNNETQDLKS